nr:hypothetical protein [Tanacetum cinerariifolium]
TSTRKLWKQKENVIVSSDSEGSGADDFCELKKITALLAKDFNRRKFYSKPTNNNLRASSTSQSTNKKQEFVKSDDKKEDKKADDKKRDMSKEINANMVFMVQIKKVLSESDKSSSSAEETIAENKNLMDTNIDALYNILKQNQGDVNDVIGSKKKTVVVTSNPLALIAEKTKVSKSKEKVVVSSDFEGSDADDFSELKKITALLAKAFN